MKKVIISILIVSFFVIAYYCLKANPNVPESSPPETEIHQKTNPEKPSNSIPKFNADQIAESETRMWKAYYAHDSKTLGKELIKALIEQFHLSPEDAFAVALDLSSATFAFQSANGDYDTHALPGLKQAYSKIKQSTHGKWDSDEAAKAELEWWVKRRTRGHDSAEEVGKSIAKLYSILYGKTNADIEKAGLLRAQAAHLRDNGGDWAKIENLLKDSYRSLVHGI